MCRPCKPINIMEVTLKLYIFYKVSSHSHSLKAPNTHQTKQLHRVRLNVYKTLHFTNQLPDVYLGTLLFAVPRFQRECELWKPDFSPFVLLSSITNFQLIRIHHCMPSLPKLPRQGALTEILGILHSSKG